MEFELAKKNKNHCSDQPNLELLLRTFIALVSSGALFVVKATTTKACIHWDPNGLRKNILCNCRKDERMMVCDSFWTCNTKLPCFRVDNHWPDCHYTSTEEMAMMKKVGSLQTLQLGPVTLNVRNSSGLHPLPAKCPQDEGLEVDVHWFQSMGWVMTLKPGSLLFGLWYQHRRAILLLIWVVEHSLRLNLSAETLPSDLKQNKTCACNVAMWTNLNQNLVFKCKEK